MAAIASLEGVRIGLLTEVGRMTQDPDTAAVLCESVKDWASRSTPAITSTARTADGNFEQVLKYVYHVRLRDTTKDQLQVRVGQGVIEYGKLIAQLSGSATTGRCAWTSPLADVDQSAEMRKMRLLLESLL